MRMLFGKKVKEFAKLQRTPLFKLAYALRVHPSAFSAAIGNKHAVQDSFVVRLADLLAVPEEAIARELSEEEADLRKGGRPRVIGIGELNRQVVLQARSRLDLKVVNVAERLGVSLPTFYYMFNRIRPIEREQAEKLAVILEVSVEQLIAPENPEWTRAHQIVTEQKQLIQHKPNQPFDPKYYKAPIVKSMDDLPAFMRPAASAPLPPKTPEQIAADLKAKTEASARRQAALEAARREVEEGVEEDYPDDSDAEDREYDAEGNEIDP